MNLIAFLADQDKIPTIDENTLSNWNVREAVRVVLFNEKGEIALMHIGKYDVYKLPGGGMEHGETLERAFVRELLEETGCEAEKIAEIGVTVEKRDDWKLIQISHCYTAKVTKMGENHLDKGEVEEEFTLHWVKNIDQAIKLIESNKSKEYDNAYITLRDSEILKKAQENI